MEKQKNHTPAEVAENVKSIIRGKYKDLTEYAHEKNITATQLYNILNGKNYMSLFSAFRFSDDFDVNIDYCTRGELPVLSPDHDYMELLRAATKFYYAVQDEDRLRDEYLRRQGNLSNEEESLFKKALKKARLAKVKSGCELVDPMNKGWAEENHEDGISKPEITENMNIMTLHEAIEKVLRDAVGPLTFTEIAKAVNKDGLYARKDGKPVPASQISARIKNYPLLFSVDRTVSPVLISLSGGNDNHLIFSSMNFKKFDPATDCRKNLPELPGNYIVALKPGCRLPACQVPCTMTKYEGLDVVYVGKSKNLRKRDYNSHFNGTAGRSTLRKSLGCFWNYPFVPRDKSNVDNGKVMYSAENEAALSAWMEENLVLFYCANENYDESELSLIRMFNPPLNLDGNFNPVNSEFRSWLSSRRSKKRA